MLEGMLEYARLRVCPSTFEQSWTVLCFINIGDNKKKLLLGRLNALDPAVNECQ